MYLVNEGSPSSGYSPALDEFQGIYAFLYSRVGNRFDAEDLTQQVAVKALPRLHEGAPPESTRAYLYAAARSVLAVFWSDRLRLPQTELSFDLAGMQDGAAPEPSVEAAAWLAQTLAALPAHYRRVLELRFLQGRSIREAARELGKTEGAVKVMQLRALRMAAQVPKPAAASRPARPAPQRRALQPVSGRSGSSSL